MKKHLLIIIEAILSLLILSLFAGLCIIEHKLLLIVLALMGSIYFVYKVVLGVRLIIDIIEGPREKKVVFAGALGEEHLDFFWKISYTNLYFDDDVLTKNYLVFADVDALAEKLQREDIIQISFYQRSRIILQIGRNDRMRE